MQNKKTAFICPFDLDRLTGTPLRAKVGINSALKFAKVTVIATSGKSIENIEFEITGKSNFLKFSLDAFKILRRTKPDIVHGITTIAIIPMILYKLFVNTKTKILFELHGWGWYETKYKYSIFKRATFLFLDLIGLWISNITIAVSNTEREFLQKKIWRKDKVVTIWDPVDFILDYKDAPNRDFVKVGYIGNAERWQGLPFLIDAARILSSDKSFLFELAGFNSNDKTKFPDIANIHYVGRVERADVPGFLSDSDILVSSRLKEPVSDLQFPHKLSEYMAVARPVIVSKASDQPYVVTTADCGFVLDEVSGEEIANFLKVFKALPKSRREQMGKNAREFCKNNLYADVFREKLKDAYESLYHL